MSAPPISRADLVPDGLRLLAWSDLDRDLLYRLLALRQRVFVVEQRCLFVDADGLDPSALHLVAGDLDGYLRLFVGDALTPSRFGRVLVAPEHRGHGLGARLVATAIAVLDDLAPRAPIHIGAQRHLDDWYRCFGFELAGAPYDDDGIPHVDMVRPARSPISASSSAG